jgi:hypothetical protein
MQPEALHLLPDDPLQALDDFLAGQGIGANFHGVVRGS